MGRNRCSAAFHYFEVLTQMIIRVCYTQTPPSTNVRRNRCLSSRQPVKNKDQRLCGQLIISLTFTLSHLRRCDVGALWCLSKSK